METGLRPAALETALRAYQAIFHGQFEAILGRPLEDDDLPALQAEKHRLLCLLAGVDLADTDPVAHFCCYQASHLDDWFIIDDQVVCPDCTPGAGRIAGGWSDIQSVLFKLPVAQEAIRRLLAKQGE